MTNIASKKSHNIDSDPASMGAQEIPSRIEPQAPGSSMPRPNLYDPAIVREAAEIIAKRCEKWEGASRSNGDWVEPLIACIRDWGDGYKLARALERECFIDPNADLVEELNYAHHDLSNVHEKTVKAWVRIVGFNPAFKVGDIVETKHGTGPIHTVYLDRAIYVVDTEGRGNGGILVDAEKVLMPSQKI